jgi:hypothetical protein
LLFFKRGYAIRDIHFMLGCGHFMRVYAFHSKANRRWFANLAVGIGFSLIQVSPWYGHVTKPGLHLNHDRIQAYKKSRSAF